MIMGENLILFASDKLRSFDRVLTTIPAKGLILNKISEWWFKKTEKLVPNHFISSEDRCMIVKKADVFPIEFVMRNYLTGSTSTSIWKNYEAGMRYYCGHKLKDGMIKDQKLERAILTPTTKGKKDELISKKIIIERGIMTKEDYEVCERYAHKLFEIGVHEAGKRGLILVDTKYEFGKTKDGNIVLIDEVHTPDSSRYWLEHSYKSRFKEGKSPEMIDKEIIRKWIRKNYEDPYTANKIMISDDIRMLTYVRYIQLYEIITGESF
jgi:Phosphoribosylaminoimidazolesuccinocarboxamide (SAICAR) synthase